MSRPVMGGGLAWTLMVRHRSGSLEKLVEQARRRNLALSAGLLLLIVATVATLVRFSRQAQRLAELQINFVAGVSHELRTPLTVIRTAAYNLRGRMAERPEHVERYGHSDSGGEQEAGRTDRAGACNSPVHGPATPSGSVSGFR